MNPDLVFGSPRWEILEILSSRPSSPIELANELGNLVHRVLSMTEKYFDGVVPVAVSGHVHAWETYETAMDSLLTHEAVAAVWSVVREANRFVEEEAPWKYRIKSSNMSALIHKEILPHHTSLLLG